MQFKSTTYKTFWDYYFYKVTPLLENIDIYVKSGEDSFPQKEVANLLYISNTELTHILQKKDIHQINKDNFFEIMKSGSSDICQLYKREVERNSPYVYSIDDIAYIYELNGAELKKICQHLSIEYITSSLLPLIFSKIKF